MATKKQGNVPANKIAARQSSQNSPFSIFDALPDLVWHSSGADGSCDFFNKAFFKFTGITPEQAMGIGWAKGAHPDDIKPTQKAFEKAVRNRKPFKLEFRLKHHDGTYHWLSATGKPFFTPDGTYDGFIGSGFDITEQKRMRDIIAASENKYRTLVNNLNDVLYSIDRKAKITYFSPAAKRMLGYTITETVGKPFTLFVHPEDKRLVSGRIKKALITGVTKSYSFRMLHKNGSTIWVNASRRAVVKDGKVVLLTGMLTNITKDKRAEDILREKQILLDLTTKSMAGGMIIISTDYRVVWLNDFLKSLYGNIENKLCYQVFSGDDSPCPGCGLYKIFEEGMDIVSFERNVQRPDGSTPTLEMVCTPIKDRKGRVAGAAEIFIAIPDRKRMLNAVAIAEDRLLTLVNNLNDTLYSTDVDGNLTYWSPQVEHLLGYAPNEAIGKHFSMFVYPEDMALVMDSIKTALSTGTAASYEFRMARKDGTLVWVRASRRARMEKGKVSELNGVLSDISKEKAIEEERREWEHKYRTVVENASEAITITQNGMRVFCNRRFAEILGYDNKEELIGVPYTDIQHPDDRESSLERYKVRIARENEMPHHSRGRHKSGEYRWFESSGCPIMWEGKPAALGISWDITERKKLEDALRESQQKYFTLIENAATGVIVAQKGIPVFVNQAFADILEYSREEIIGKHYIDFVHPDDRDIAVKRYSKCLEREKLPLIRYRLLTKRGKIKWFEFNSIVIDWQGKPAILGFAIDVTRQKKAEDALRKSEQSYFNLIEQANIGIMVIQDDLRQFVNPKFAEITGYPQEELIGKRYDSILHPDEREKIRRRQALKLKGEVIPRIRSRIITKNGDIKWVESHSIVVDWKDKPALLVFAIDVTEQKRAEEALAESEKKYFTLIERSPQGISVGQNGLRKFVNNKFADMVGYSREELMGREFLGTVHPDDRKQIEELNECTLQAGDFSLFRCRLLTKQGKAIWVEMYSILIDWDDSPAVLVFIRDITTRKQLEDDLQQLLHEIKDINSGLSRSNRDLQDFAAAVASTLQEPLRKIKPKNSDPVDPSKLNNTKRHG